MKPIGALQSILAASEGSTPKWTIAKHPDELCEAPWGAL